MKLKYNAVKDTYNVKGLTADQLTLIVAFFDVLKLDSARWGNAGFNFMQDYSNDPLGGDPDYLTDGLKFRASFDMDTEVVALEPFDG